MEVIEEEVRRMAMEEAEVKAKECPICFDPMVSKLLWCKQCNQAFHYRLKNECLHKILVFTFMTSRPLLSTVLPLA